MNALLQAQNSALAVALTITLHWWVVPLALCVVALLVLFFGERNDSGPFAGLASALIAILLAVVALAFCLGHLA